MNLYRVPLLFLLLCFSTFLLAQTPTHLTSSEVYHELKKLNFVGSVLYLAAHPDDENTGLISHFSNHVYANTAYLSLTRGDGGQNLIGSELREILGVIRTEELLEARKVDGGQQFFTRANDFGFSKNPEETFRFWDKEQILGDVVHIIREFRPDIIINRFDHRTPGTTHGHHTASAILGMEAFDIADQAHQFPNSYQAFGGWQPKRIFFNASWFFFGSKEAFDKADKSAYIAIESGNFFPLLGLSNGEIAALSRSKHQSQGFGSTGVRGSQKEYLEFLKGEPVQSEDLFEGINTRWTRLKGGEKIGKILEPLAANFDFTNPSKILPALLEAYPLITQLEDPHWRRIKTQQIEELILKVSGVFIEAIAETPSITPKTAFNLNVEITNRSNHNISLLSIKNNNKEVLWNTTELLLPNTAKHFAIRDSNATSKTLSSPYWLTQEGTLGMYNIPDKYIGFPEAPAAKKLTFELQFDTLIIPFDRDVIYKYTDPAQGEVYRPFEILPEATTSFKEKAIVFAEDRPQQVAVEVHAGKDALQGELYIDAPKGWKVTPEYQEVQLSTKGEAKTYIFSVTPPKYQHEGHLKARVVNDGNIFDLERIAIAYDHIPHKSVLLPSESKIVKLALKKHGEHIGYIHGAGDAVPESLEQIGYRVSILDPKKISRESIQDLDAIVLGIRAYNTLPELVYATATLLEYVENGGTLIVQYNTNHALVTDQLAPYPVSLSRNRVTDETADVAFLAPTHDLLNKPNQITAEDFDGWVQERGLYFPDDWASEFTPILGMNDSGEAQTQGALLIAPYGKGHYIYTGLSFFRELPAGVPGAYRLFANLLSIGK